MKLLSPIFNWAMKRRYERIDFFRNHPIDTQHGVFFELLNTAKNTEWGRKYDFASISTIKDYQERVPISRYEDLFPYLDRVFRGEDNVLWPSKIKLFSKSSGTTNAKSKFIPVSEEALKECHYKGGKDMITLYLSSFPHRNPLAGKGLSVGGSVSHNEVNPGTYYGDVSGLIIKNLPGWAEFLRTPSVKTSLMSNWEEKIDQMVKETATQDVTNLAGVPTWTLVLLQRLLEKTGAENVLEVWPNLQLFIHGAVSFTPYKEHFQKLIPSNGMNYMETYTASEGFFGLQDLPGTEEMLLMLDYGIFYEFVPMDEINKEHPKALTLEEVEEGKNYALVVSSNAGLWRYMIGDTVRFTSTNPFRIRVTGRTKHFLNAFGEEVIIENAEQAISEACQRTKASISNYTAAPIFFGKNGENGGHEWLFEFETQPNNIELFGKVLDEKLKDINSDYEAKRFKDMALGMPVIHSLPQGTFYQWLERKGKVGGQHKVPRLSNDRKLVEELLAI